MRGYRLSHRAMKSRLLFFPDIRSQHCTGVGCKPFFLPPHHMDATTSGTLLRFFWCSTRQNTECLLFFFLDVYGPNLLYG